MPAVSQTARLCRYNQKARAAPTALQSLTIEDHDARFLAGVATQSLVECRSIIPVLHALFKGDFAAADLYLGVGISGRPPSGRYATMSVAELDDGRYCNNVTGTLLEDLDPLENATKLSINRYCCFGVPFSLAGVLATRVIQPHDSPHPQVVIVQGYDRRFNYAPGTGNAKGDGDTYRDAGDIRGAVVQSNTGQGHLRTRTLLTNTEVAATLVSNMLVNCEAEESNLPRGDITFYLPEHGNLKDDLAFSIACAANLVRDTMVSAPNKDALRFAASATTSLFALHRAALNAVTTPSPDKAGCSRCCSILLSSLRHAFAI